MKRLVKSTKSYALDLVIALMIALVPCTMAFGQTAGPSPETQRNLELFRAFFASEAHRAQVSVALREAEKAITPACTRLAIKDLADYHAYSPVQFSPSDSTLESGLWREVWIVDLCGKERRRSVLISAHEGQVKTMAYLPGRSNVDPVLGRELLPRASASARLYLGQALGSACGEVPHLVNTRLVGMPQDVKVDIEKAPPDIQAYLRENVSGIWRENWYFRACGHVAELKITFLIKISGGTTFNISKGGVGPVS